MLYKTVGYVDTEFLSDDSVNVGDLLELPVLVKVTLKKHVTGDVDKWDQASLPLRQRRKVTHIVLKVVDASIMHP